MGEESLKKSVRTERERRERGGRESKRSIGHYLARAGGIGWLVVVPTLLGAFAGRWLDRRFDTGVTLTGALLVLGLAAGCYLAWELLYRGWREP
jgi:ATP synthase protein I